MVSLNEWFEDWWAAIGERLLTHKSNIDRLFEVYYRALLCMKDILLEEEYKLLDELSELDQTFDELAQRLYSMDRKALFF